MPAIRAIAWAQARSRSRALVALAVLLGLSAGVAISLAAGARRSSDVVDRFRAEQRVADAVIQPFAIPPERLAELRNDPSITAASPVAIVYGRIKGSNDDPLIGTALRAAVDGTYGDVLDRSVIVAGEPLDQRDPDAVQISESIADEQDIAVGDEIVLETMDNRQIYTSIFLGEPVGELAGPELELEVTSIARAPLEVIGGPDFRRILLPAALWAARGEPMPDVEEPPARSERFGGFDNVLFARAADGDFDAAAKTARRIFSDDPELFVQPTEEATAGTRDLARVMAIAFVIGCIAVAVASAVVGSQAMSRHLSLGAEDAPTLASMGINRRARALANAIPVAAAGAGGVVIAIVVATLLSGRFPVGDLRIVEPDPGVRSDPLVLGLGAAGMAVGVIVSTAVHGWRAEGVGAGRRRVLPLVGQLPTVVATALRLASGKRIPVRPALGGAVVAFAAVIAVTTFSASLDRFVGDPARDGWAWDAEVGLPDLALDDEALDRAAELADHPAIDELLYARVGTLGASLGRIDTEVVGMEAIEGSIGLTVLRGRLPTSPDEIAVGPETADAGDVGLGDSLEVRGPTETRSFEVTGIARFPVINNDNPAAGLALTLDGLSTLTVGLPDPFGYPTTLVSWAEGWDAERARDALDAPVYQGEAVVSTDATNLARVRGLPRLLAATMATVGALAVVHTLLVSVRRQRRDVAVARALGFTRPQVRAVVFTQALAYGALGLVIGVPLGLVVGRWTWRLLADQIGAANDPLTPLVTYVVTVLALAAVVLLAIVPARLAARANVSADLRDE